MPDWLLQSVAVDSHPAEVLLLRICFGLFWGICVACVYFLAHGRRQPQSLSIAITLVMLSALIAMVSIVIGNDVAKAFSLVGALSIVRFRTVVEDTRDTAFVIFAVIVGMAAGAGQQLLPLIAIPVVGCAAVLMTRLGVVSVGGSEIGDGRLTLRIQQQSASTRLIEPLIQRYSSSFEIRALETVNKGNLQEIRYQFRRVRRENLPELVQQLQQMDGVESVKIRFGRNGSAKS